jgi:hypothetical protein
VSLECIIGSASSGIIFSIFRGVMPGVVVFRSSVVLPPPLNNLLRGRMSSATSDGGEQQHVVPSYADGIYGPAAEREAVPTAWDHKMSMKPSVLAYVVGVVVVVLDTTTVVVDYC